MSSNRSACRSMQRLCLARTLEGLEGFFAHISVTQLRVAVYARFDPEV